MKKGLILLVFGVFFNAALAGAQENFPVFSPALFLDNAHVKTTPGGSLSGTPATTARTGARTHAQMKRTQIRYRAGQTDLTEEQKTALLKVIDRINEGKASSIRLDAFSDERWHSHVRLIKLSEFFRSYAPKTYVAAVIAEPGAETKDTNNSVYVTEVP